MKINKVQFDGFGIFTAMEATDFSPGLNVIFGNNEFGKSTFLEFLRRTLFGYPDRRSKTNLYPAINGGRQGGRIFCRFADGTETVIERILALKNGAPSLRNADGTEQYGQDILHRRLGVSEYFFRNVYAITLDELNSIASLSDDEIKHKIYGAGLETGQLSLTGVQQELQEEADCIFKPRGSTPAINQLLPRLQEMENRIRQCRDNLPHYQECLKKIQAFELNIADAENKLVQLRREKSRLENLQNGWKNFITLQSLRKKLSELGSVPVFPEAIETETAELRTACERREENTRKIATAIRQDKMLFENLHNPRRLTDHAGDIEALQRASEKFSTAEKDSSAINDAVEKAQSKISGELTNLGPNWTIEQLLTLNFTHAEREYAVNIIAESQRLTEKIRSLEDARNILLNSKAANRKSFPSLPQTGLFLSCELFMAGIIAGIFLSHVLLFASLILFICGAAGLLFLYVSPAHETPDRQLQALDEQLSQLNQEQQRTARIWHDFLQKKRLQEQLGAQAFLNFAASVERIKELRQQLTDLRKRGEVLTEWITAIRQKIDTLFAECGLAKSTDTITNIELLNRALRDGEEQLRRKNDLAEKIRRAETDLQSEHDELAASRRKLAELYKKYAVTDETQFRQLLTAAKEKKSLQNNIEVLENSLRQSLGADTDTEFAAFSPEACNRSLADATTAIATLETRKAELYRSCGEEKNRAEQLRNEDDLTNRQTDLEIQRRHLNDLAEAWTIRKTALYLLDKAINKFQAERQPAVITRAAALFSAITEGRYQSLAKSLNHDELQIFDKNGKTLSVKELSRGTLEELFLAMRLALIEEYETREEPMPIVLDDIFVNFDDDRRRRAINAIADFAASRQVIILTCHQSLLKNLREAGAAVIAFQPFAI